MNFRKALHHSSTVGNLFGAIGHKDFAPATQNTKFCYMTDGTVKIWQDDPGYRMLALKDLAELPSRSQGVFALLSGRTVVFIDLIEQIYSPAKAFERAAARPEVKPYEPDQVVFLSVLNWDAAISECRRLREYYYPAVKIRIR